MTFRYKNEPEAINQYGLVAEEVARVHPELVSYGPDGKVETVNYLTLTSMLLNELQKQTLLSAALGDALQKQIVENQRRPVRSRSFRRRGRGWNPSEVVQRAAWPADLARARKTLLILVLKGGFGLWLP